MNNAEQAVGTVEARNDAWGGGEALLGETGITQRLDFAVRAAREAGRLTLDWFSRPGVASADVGVETKADGSPVTLADKAAERHIRGMIEREWPDDGVLGEEYDDIEATPRENGVGVRWVIDPIDGTFSFARGVPLYATLLAAEPVGPDQAVLGPPEVGVIFLPGLDEIVYAGRGGGAWHRVGERRAVPARVSAIDSMREGCVIATSWDYYRWDGVEEVMERVLRSAAHTRGWSDAYAWALVATGRVEAVVEPKMAPWDVAPVLPILAEAGGRFTTWEGDASVHGGTAIASNGLVHDEMLRAVRG